MSVETIDRPTVEIHESLTLDPPCEAVFDTHYPCGEPAKNIVRFKSHGCVRDGHGVLLCAACRDWIASQDVGCSACDQPAPAGALFIVSSTSLR